MTAGALVASCLSVAGSFFPLWRDSLSPASPQNLDRPNLTPLGANAMHPAADHQSQHSLQRDSPPSPALSRLQATRQRRVVRLSLGQAGTGGVGPLSGKVASQFFFYFACVPRFVYFVYKPHFLCIFFFTPRHSALLRLFFLDHLSSKIILLLAFPFSSFFGSNTLPETTSPDTPAPRFDPAWTRWLFGKSLAAFWPLSLAAGPATPATQGANASRA